MQVHEIWFSSPREVKPYHLVNCPWGDCGHHHQTLGAAERCLKKLDPKRLWQVYRVEGHQPYRRPEILTRPLDGD